MFKSPVAAIAGLLIGAAMGGLAGYFGQEKTSDFLKGSRRKFHDFMKKGFPEWNYFDSENTMDRLLGTATKDIREQTPLLKELQKKQSSISSGDINYSKKHHALQEKINVAQKKLKSAYQILLSYKDKLTEQEFIDASKYGKDVAKRYYGNQPVDEKGVPVPNLQNFHMGRQGFSYGGGTLTKIGWTGAQEKTWGPLMEWLVPVSYTHLTLPTKA